MNAVTMKSREELLEGMSTNEIIVLQRLLKSKKAVPLDEIIECMGIDPSSKSARHSAIVRMKYLNDKTSQKGWIITRTSGIGRGAKATYSITKKF